MKNIAITRVEHRDNIPAVIVENAFIGEYGPVAGCFEVFDVDDSVVHQDGFAHVIVICARVGLAKDDEGLELKVPGTHVMGVVGHTGDVITEVRFDG